MIKQKMYTYLGENGTITSPVFLRDIYSVCKVRLIADKGKVLTNGAKTVEVILVPENEVSQWQEVLAKQE